MAIIQSTDQETELTLTIILIFSAIRVRFLFLLLSFTCSVNFAAIAMGKRKLEMDYISDPKKRKKTYDTRREGLIKKLHELTVLCDVKACAIIYDGSAESPEIWPSNHGDVLEMIEKYKSSGQSGKTYGLADLFDGKRRKIEEELCTLRKKNIEAKYPAPVEALNVLTEPELRQFAANLGNKLMEVKWRIDELKNTRSTESEFNQTQGTLMNSSTPFPSNFTQFHEPFQICRYN